MTLTGSLNEPKKYHFLFWTHHRKVILEKQCWVYGFFSHLAMHTFEPDTNLLTKPVEWDGFRSSLMWHNVTFLQRGGISCLPNKTSQYDVYI